MLPAERSVAGGEKEFSMPGFEDEVTQFLDKMASIHGEKSVLYIR